MSRRDVSIVIPSWNGRHLLETFLPSVIAAAAAYVHQTGAASDILIVDDGSSDGTVDWLAERASGSPVPLRAVRHDANLGFGEACNRGMRVAAHDLVFLLNNDVAVEPDAIAPLVARFAAPQDAGRLFAVHGRVLDYATGVDVGTGKIGAFSRGFLRVHRSFVTREPVTGPFFSIFASGGSAVFDRHIFNSLGGFDPLFAPFYLEDVEISYRAWKRGFTVEYEPQSVARHRFSSTIAPLAGRRVPRIGQRNRLILHWIHLHDRRWFASHLCWVALLALTGPLTLKPRLTVAVFDALRRLPAIRARRRDERRLATRSDRDVLGVFTRMTHRPDVRPYDDPAELTR